MYTLTRSSNKVDPVAAAALAAAIDLSSLNTLVMGKNNQNDGDSDSGKLRTYFYETITFFARCW